MIQSLRLEPFSVAWLLEQLGLRSTSNSKIETLNNRIEWQHNFQIIKPFGLNLGYQYREQQGENIGTFPQKIIANHAGFAQVQLNLKERLFATAGFRQDSFNTVGDATTYRVTGGISA